MPNGARVRLMSLPAVVAVCAAVPVAGAQLAFLQRIEIPAEAHHLIGSDREVVLEQEGGDIVRLFAGHSPLTHSGAYTGYRSARLQVAAVSFLLDGPGAATLRPAGASEWLETRPGAWGEGDSEASSVPSAALDGCPLVDDDARQDVRVLRELLAVRAGGASTRTAVCDLDQSSGGFDLYRFEVQVVAGTTAAFDVGVDAGRTHFTVSHAFGNQVRLVPRVPGDPAALREELAASSAQRSVAFALADLGAGCAPSPTTGCLHNGLFRVSGPWRLGSASGQIQLVDDRDAPGTSLLAYWEPHSIDNKECVIKVLDGRALNGHWWVFAGCATTVGFDATVEQTLTGESVLVSNPPGTRAVAFVDTGAFADPAARPGETYAGPLAGLPADTAAALAAFAGQGAVKAGTTPATIAYLGPEDRFELEGSWTLGNNSGLVYFSGDQDAPGTTLLAFWTPDGAANKEGIVKVLDGRALNGCYWLFDGFASTVGYDISVRDATTGVVKQISNTAGQPARSHADTAAFCDAPGAVAPTAGEKASASPNTITNLRNTLNGLASYVSVDGESGDLLPMHSLIMPGFALGSGNVNGVLIGAVRADISGGVIRAHDRVLANVYCLPNANGSLQYALFMDHAASSNSMNGESPLSVSLGGVTVNRDLPFALGVASGALADALRTSCYGSPVVLTPDERNKMSLASELAFGSYYNNGTHNNSPALVGSPQGVNGQITIESRANATAYMGITWRDHPTLPGALELLSQGGMAMSGQEVVSGLVGVPGSGALAFMFVSGNSQGGQVSPATGQTQYAYVTLQVPPACLVHPWQGQ